MHPTLARYLDLKTAVDTLSREEQGQALDAGERPFAEAARAFPEERALLLASRGPGRPSPEVQQALLLLAAHAAAAALREDEALGRAVADGRAALMAEGASAAEADQLIASLVLEEAFGVDEDPDTFDRDFVEETLRGLPPLARLTREKVEALIDGFADGAAEGEKQAHRLAAQALLEAAWGEGPQPINSEHLQEALERVLDQLGDAQEAMGIEALRRFVAHLHQAGLVGSRRMARLNAPLDLAAAEASHAGRAGPGRPD